MQNIIIVQPYVFVPPCRGNFWPRALRPLLPTYLRRCHGVHAVELLGVERLRQSIDAGHGILITPNHCRPPDPMVVMQLGYAVGRPVHTMASWHLFKHSAFQTWVLRHMGVFSVHREGLDREALKCATQILVAGRRPLVLFPEGVISRTNDQVHHLMEGTAFIARTAARQRAAGGGPGKVVVHPVAIRYFFEGHLAETLSAALAKIEQRLSWRPQTHLEMTTRIIKAGEALLTLKELEYFGAPTPGDLPARLAALTDHLLVPLENEWLKGRRDDPVVTRVKNLRFAILPDMVAQEIDEAERARRWQQLADIYLAQQLSFYPPGYFSPEPTPERLLETVERFEENLTDKDPVHPPIRAVVEVGEAIEVSPVRERGAETDPLMARIRTQMETMLAGLAKRTKAGS
ncbi:MAG: 1-acyl-sn-glycerol-3-phosphate acyltransferase [bacterium]